MMSHFFFFLLLLKLSWISTFSVSSRFWTDSRCVYPSRSLLSFLELVFSVKFGKFSANIFWTVFSPFLSLFLCWHYIYVNMRNGASHFLRLFIFLHFFPTPFFRLCNLYRPSFKFANSANSNLLISPSNKFFIWFWYFSTFQFPLSKKSPCLY